MKQITVVSVVLLCCLILIGLAVPLVHPYQGLFDKSTYGVWFGVNEINNVGIFTVMISFRAVEKGRYVGRWGKPCVQIFKHQGQGGINVCPLQ